MEDKDFKKLFDNGITITSRDSVTVFAEQVEKLLDALEKVSGISGAFVTDRTSYADFMLDQEDIQDISNILGIPVDENDYFSDLAARLHAKANPVQ